MGNGKLRSFDKFGLHARAPKPLNSNVREHIRGTLGTLYFPNPMPADYHEVKAAYQKLSGRLFDAREKYYGVAVAARMDDPEQIKVIYTEAAVKLSGQHYHQQATHEAKRKYMLRRMERTREYLQMVVDAQAYAPHLKQR